MSRLPSNSFRDKYINRIPHWDEEDIRVSMNVFSSSTELNYNVNYVIIIIIIIVQWNSSITDTIGTSKLVLLIEVSFVEGSFNIIKYQNGTRQVSLVVRCPLSRGVLYKGLFHCNR